MSHLSTMFVASCPMDKQMVTISNRFNRSIHTTSWTVTDQLAIKLGCILTTMMINDGWVRQPPSQTAVSLDLVNYAFCCAKRIPLFTEGLALLNWSYEWTSLSSTERSIQQTKVDGYIARSGRSMEALSRVIDAIVTLSQYGAQPGSMLDACINHTHPKGFSWSFLSESYVLPSFCHDGKALEDVMLYMDTHLAAADPHYAMKTWGSKHYRLVTSKSNKRSADRAQLGDTNPSIRSTRPPPQPMAPMNITAPPQRPVQVPPHPHTVTLSSLTEQRQSLDQYHLQNQVNLLTRQNTEMVTMLGQMRAEMSELYSRFKAKLNEEVVHRVTDASNTALSVKDLQVRVWQIEVASGMRRLVQEPTAPVGESEPAVKTDDVVVRVGESEPAVKADEVGELESVASSGLKSEPIDLSDGEDAVMPALE